MKQRYLGSSPFETTDKDIFFGRTKETQEFVDLLKVEKLIVLYAKSGMGKTSLINAGVIPKLEEAKNFIHWTIRLRSFIDSEKSMQPQDTLRLALKKIATPDNIIGKLVEKTTEPTEKLWLHLKALQYEKATKEANTKSLVLFFDQFEELFTYAANEQKQFKELLSKLLQAPAPEILKETAKQLTDNEQVNLLYAPLDIKIVFIIRADRMSLLDTMKDYLPYVLHTTYEMKALTRRQARQAIEEPAAKTDENFDTPPFRYDLKSLETILNYLSTGEKDEKTVAVPIESFQLQIICKDIENRVKSKQNETPNLILPKDVKGLKTIFEQYYVNALAKTTQKAVEELALRKLIEENLIHEGRRLSFDESYCEDELEKTLKNEQLVKELLKNLVEKRLLRLEPNNVGGNSYEVSHDTLIDPIEKARKERHAKEQRKRIIKYLAGGLAVLLVILYAFSYVYDLKDKAENAREKAEIAQKEAEQERDKAEKALQLVFELRNTNDILKAENNISKAMKQIDIARSMLIAGYFMEANTHLDSASRLDSSATTKYLIKSLLKQTKKH